MPRVKATGEYPPDWPEISTQVKEEAGWCCERCGHRDDRPSGHVLTVHHLDGNKANCARWNLAALCQKCHLHCQGKLFLPQFFMFEHSAWFLPHVLGYYKSLGLEVLLSPNGSFIFINEQEWGNEEAQEAS